MSPPRASRHITVMILPDGVGRSYALRIPTWLLKSLALALTSALVALALFSEGYADLARRADRLAAVEAANARLASDFAEVQAQLALVHARLDELARLDAQLRSEVALPPPGLQPATPSTGPQSAAPPTGATGAFAAIRSMASSPARAPQLPIATAGLLPLGALSALPALSLGPAARPQTGATDFFPATAGDEALAEAAALAAEAADRLTSLSEVQGTVEDRIAEAAHYPDAWPVLGRITSRFGERHSPFDWGLEFHEGVDIAAPYGTPIHAAAAGVVVEAGWVAGFGRAVKIDHGNGLVTLYGHQSRVRVHVGQTVAKGQVIGYIGTSGLSTGPHLHFGVYRNGVPVDPLRYLLSDRFGYLRH